MTPFCLRNQLVTHPCSLVGWLRRHGCRCLYVQITLAVYVTVVDSFGRCWAMFSGSTRCRGRLTVVCCVAAAPTLPLKCGTLLLASCSTICLVTRMRSVWRAWCRSEPLSQFVVIITQQVWDKSSWNFESSKYYVKVLCLTRHKTDHFDILPGQSLGIVLKKLNPTKAINTRTS